MSKKPDEPTPHKPDENKTSDGYSHNGTDNNKKTDVPKKPTEAELNADAAKKASSITSIPQKVLEHIIDGVPKGKNYVEGGHSRQSTNVRIDKIIKIYPNGVYEAEVSIYNRKSGKYIKKHVNDGPNGEKRNHTMFPDSWTPDRIKVEVDSAWQNRKPSTNYPNNGWEGVSQSGVRIEGFIDSVTGQMKNAYPVLN